MIRRLGLTALSLIISVGVVYAEDDEIGIKMGATSIHGVHTNNFTMGVSYQDNTSFKSIKPRVDFDYVNISDKAHSKGVKALYKGSINGVYQFHDKEKRGLNPYAVFGVGYEHVDGEVKDIFDSNAFAQGGLGVTYKTKKYGKFNVEGKALQILGAPGQNNEYSLTAGVSVPVTPSDEDECPIKIDGPDEDRDGVLDSVDQCPGTPCYFSVDQYGCPVKATLRLHFEFNKYKIRPESLPMVENFAEYLKSHQGTHVLIVGHTDSIGTRRYNQILSEKRAEEVKKTLITLGVSPNRLEAEGRGEDEPIATNATPEGRALNRRIEAKLISDDKYGK